MKCKKNISKQKTFTIPQIGIIIVLICLAIIVFYPFYLTVIKSFKTPDQDLYNPYSLTFPLYIENYSIAWSYVAPYIFNSLFVAVCSTILGLVVATATAYGFTRFNFPGKNAIYMAILALMMVPGVLTLIPKYTIIIDMHLMNNFLGIILPGITGSLPFRLMLLRTFFAGVPNDLFEAAEIDGASHFKQYLNIMIPMCSPILATIAINSFMGSWNGAVWPKLILTDERYFTIPIGLISFTREFQEHFRDAMSAPLAGYVISSIPLMILFAFASKQFIKGLTSGAFKM